MAPREKAPVPEGGFFMPGADDGPHRHDDTTRTNWPWMLPEGTPGTPPHRHARYGDGAWLGAIRGFWAGRYEIGIRRRWFRKEWLAVRKDGSGDLLRGRDHAALSQAMYADWLAVTGLEAHARVAAEEAAAEASEPVAVPLPPPPGDEAYRGQTLFDMDLRLVRVPRYVDVPRPRRGSKR